MITALALVFFGVSIIIIYIDRDVSRVNGNDSKIRKNFEKNRRQDWGNGDYSEESSYNILTLTNRLKSFESCVFCKEVFNPPKDVHTVSPHILII